MPHRRRASRPGAVPRSGLLPPVDRLAGRSAVGRRTRLVLRSAEWAWTHRVWGPDGYRLRVRIQSINTCSFSYLSSLPFFAV